LSWPKQCVGYSLHIDADPSISFDDVKAIAGRSFQSWANADCGQGTKPGITIQELEPVACDEITFNIRGRNANIIAFRPDLWPYPNAPSVLALTTVTYGIDNGYIYDVDIEVNTSNGAITITDTDVRYDLESIITHEVGHFLGLAHSNDGTATMFAYYGGGSTSLRTLKPDDQAGVCAIYPADRQVGQCDPSPKGGLKKTCIDPRRAPPDGCACSVKPTQSSPWIAMSLTAILAGFALRRRRGTH